MSTAIKHLVPERVKPSFVIFYIWALWRSGLSVRMSKITRSTWRLNPLWHRMLYGCTHMATLRVKGLMTTVTCLYKYSASSCDFVSGFWFVCEFDFDSRCQRTYEYDQCWHLPDVGLWNVVPLISRTCKLSLGNAVRRIKMRAPNYDVAAYSAERSLRSLAGSCHGG